MSETETRQHIIVDVDFHKAIKMVAGLKGVDMTEAVQELLLSKPDFFKKKLAEVRRNS